MAHWTPDAISWHEWTPPLFPDSEKVVASTHVGDTFYELRGKAGRWYVTRRESLAAPVERTQLYRSRQQAADVYTHLTGAYA
jgi:hypothetical protein